jgi:hypothetical protein
MLGLSSVGSVGCLGGADIRTRILGGRGSWSCGWREGGSDVWLDGGGRGSLTGRTGIRDTWMEGFSDIWLD